MNALSRQSGISLIELMVGMTLSLVLLVSIGYLFAGSRQSYRSQEQSARMQETGRFALDAIARSVRQAGAPEISIVPGDLKVAFSGMAISGTNGAAESPDALVIEYDGMYYKTAVGKEGYFDRDCETQKACNTNSSDTVLVTPGVPGCADAAVNPVVLRFRDSWGMDVADNELQCAGQMLDATAAVVKPTDGNATAQPQVSNIEDLQFTYGIDGNGDGSMDQWVDLPADFGQVVAVRACVVVRSETGAGALNQPYIGCNGARVIPNGNDTRVRRAFVETIVLRTRAGGA
jgi:type IV pilus assembly protein PilW